MSSDELGRSLCRFLNKGMKFDPVLWGIVIYHYKDPRSTMEGNTGFEHCSEDVDLSD